MTILICTGFYIYVIFSVNVYRKEIELRRKEGYAIKGKAKAPYPLRISVLLSLVASAKSRKSTGRICDVLYSEKADVDIRR